MRCVDRNASLGQFAVVAGKEFASATAVSKHSYLRAARAEEEARTVALSRPTEQVFVIQVTAQFKAVPHVYEVHPQ